MKIYNTVLVFKALLVLFVVAMFGGWIANIVAVINTIHGPIDAMFIARCVGIFAAPLGGILGYI
jgi:hypothetical protein